MITGNKRSSLSSVWHRCVGVGEGEHGKPTNEMAAVHSCDMCGASGDQRICLARQQPPPLAAIAATQRYTCIRNLRYLEASNSPA
jgi:hypothetical protein